MMTKVTYTGYREPIVRDFGSMDSIGGNRIGLALDFGGGRLSYLYVTSHPMQWAADDEALVADCVVDDGDFQHIATQSLNPSRFRYSVAPVGGSEYRRITENIVHPGYSQTREMAASFEELGWAALVTASESAGRIVMRAVKHDGAVSDWPTYTEGEGARLREVWGPRPGRGDYSENASVVRAGNGAVVVVYRVLLDEQAQGWRERLCARYCRIEGGELSLGPELVLLEGVDTWQMLNFRHLLPVGEDRIAVTRLDWSGSGRIYCMIFGEDGFVGERFARDGWYDREEVMFRVGSNILLYSDTGAGDELLVADLGSEGLSSFREVPAVLEGDVPTGADFGSYVRDAQQHGALGVVLRPSSHYGSTHLRAISFDPSGRGKVSSIALPEGMHEERRHALQEGALYGSIVMTQPDRLVMLQRSRIGASLTPHLWGAIIDVDIERLPPTAISGRYRAQSIYFR